MEKLLAKTHIRIKRVKPSRNLCIRLFRKWKKSLMLEPLPVLIDQPIDTLFWSLLHEGIFPCEDSIFRSIDILLKAGCSVQAKPPKPQNNNEFELTLNCYYCQEKPILQIRLKLSLQDNEATMCSFLTNCLPTQDHDCIHALPYHKDRSHS